MTTLAPERKAVYWAVCWSKDCGHGRPHRLFQYSLGTGVVFFKCKCGSLNIVDLTVAGQSP